jgi:nitrate/nitrite transporter NarK
MQDQNQQISVQSSRTLWDRLIKYVVDPRRVSHKYLLQFLLCLFLTGPTFFDNFFNACVTDIILRLAISHERFSLLISVPSITGVFCGVIAGIVSAYGSTLTASLTAVLSYVGAIIICYGISESSFATIMIGRLIFVLFWNLLGSVQKVIIFREFTGKSLACIFGLKIVAIRMGAVSGLYFAGDITAHMSDSLPAAFYFALALSGISLLCTICFSYLRRGTSAARLILPLIVGHRSSNRQDGTLSQAPRSVKLSIPRNAWICCLVMFFYYGGIVPFETFGVDYLVTDYGMSKGEAGKAMALLPFFSFFSPVISPVFSSVRNQLWALVFAQIFVAVGIVADVLHSPHSPILYLCVMGIGHLVVANAVWLALASLSPSDIEKTNAASISSAIYALSGFFFNWLTGTIRDISGSYRDAMALLSLLVCLGTAVAVYLLGWASWHEQFTGNEMDRILLDNSPEPSNDDPRISHHNTNTHIDPNHFSR